MRTIRAYTEDDGPSVWQLRKQAFGGPPEMPDTHAGLWGDDLHWHGLVTSVDGAVDGFLRIRPYRQFFGGRVVPMGGIASVTVASHARGAGAGGALLRALVPALREFGHPISALYPTVPRFYRRWGWERAGVLESVDLPFTAFRALPASSLETPPRRAVEAEFPEIHERYLRLAATVDGMLDRSTPQFKPSELAEFPIRTLLPGGHLLATPNHDQGRLDVDELLADDPATAAWLCAEIVSWGAVLDSVRLAVTDESLLGWIDAGVWGQSSVDRKSWFLRVVDLPAAVAARGWPMAGLLRDSVLEFEVVDEHAPWQAGPYRLIVADGAVHLEPGGRGSARMHANALGPWFAGAATAGELRRAGLLTGDTGGDRLLSALPAAVGTPRMADYF